MSIIDRNQAGADWRRRFASFADALIPGGAGLPSASAADVHGIWVDRMLACRPDMADTIMTIIQTTNEPKEELKRLQASEPARFEEFASAVANAYFLNPEVRKLFGYPGHAPQRKKAKPGEAEEYLRDGLLDPVIQRGPIYRPAPA
jgi:hypothetical protein